MEIQRRLLLALALLSVLLVNLELSQAHSIQESLPPLVDESGNDKVPPVDNVKREPIEAKKANEGAAGDVSAKKEDQSEPGHELNKESPSGSKRQIEESSEASQASPAEEAKPKAAEEKKPAAGDINDLLASKNDDENDLNGVSLNAKRGEEPKPMVVEVIEGKKNVDLDSPVDISNSKGQANDERFHYSVGQPTHKANEATVGNKAIEGGESAPPSMAAESTKESQTVPPEATTQPLSTTLIPLEDKENKADRVGRPEEDKKDEEKTESVVGGSVTEATSSNKAPEVQQPVVSTPVSEPSSSSQAPPSTSSEKPASSSTSSEPATTLVVSEKKGPEATSQVSSSEGAAISSEKPKDLPSSGSASSEKPNEAPSSVAPPLASSTPGSVTSSEKAPSVPSVLAVALGTALGAAVNPISGGSAGGKQEKPLVAGARASSTTPKPSATGSTTRKPSSDRWDRPWFTLSTGSSSTSTTTGSPSTRRFPILPSIRRRFRPYNRFGPFPWGGADSYSPVGGEPGIDFPMEPSTSSAVPPAGKPRRRGSSTEAPKSTTSSAKDDSNSDDEDEVLTQGSTPASRRRNPNGGKRRHHHHEHHHNRHHYHPGGGNQRRRHHHSGDRDERPYFGEPSAFESTFNHPRPPPFNNGANAGGFGLFNTGPQTSSGFDLLNPLSWLDQADNNNNKRQRGQGPRVTPGSRPPPLGGPPRPYEGEYNESEHQGHRDREEPHHHSRPGHNDRGSEYDSHHDHNDHHHDCHDHDYDHHHDYHHRPGRPYREPYRPPSDYGTYPSGSSYGNRPGRPYNRQREPTADVSVSRDEEPAPSLYNSRPLSSPDVPRRVPSIFSPFESLFGTLDDELFGLRSTILESGPRASASKPGGHHFDTVVTSPKISTLAGVASSPAAGKDLDSDQKHPTIAETIVNTRSALEGDNKHETASGRQGRRDRVY